MFDHERNNMSFVTGLITGGIIGALAALLMTPKSGRELRKDITDKGAQIVDETNMLMGEAKDKASKLITDAKEKAHNLLEDAKAKANKLIDGAGNIATGGKNMIDEGISKAKDAVKSASDYSAEEKTRNVKKNS